MKDFKKMIQDAKTKMDLYEVAGYLNNYPQHINVDKVTFMGFMDFDRAKAHCERMLAEIEVSK